MEKAEYIWHSGEFVRWDEAQVHVLSHGLHYGTGVFEGVRCYNGEQGPAIFRHSDHLQRLEDSARMYYLDLPFSKEEIGEATRELIRKNGLADCYIRPLAFRGYGEMGLYAKSAPVEVIIAAWPWGAYLGEDGTKNGIRAKISSWRRVSAASLIPHAKASGQYLNSILAKTESANAGYEEAILLDERGFVCEGSGENIFVVKEGRVFTPPQAASILDGISRKSVIRILGDEGIQVEERDVARSELYLADEVFMCGTAAEVVPVREIDDHPIGAGEPGDVTKLAQSIFQDAIHGRDPRYLDWIDPVNQPVRDPGLGKVTT
ncbi:MAG: branched-chain amino acid transaminase [Solirubrobacterales bacterium]|nr:branched-chain amino acid transaminase [Solirubrobacterales bacterium]